MFMTKQCVLIDSSALSEDNPLPQELWMDIFARLPVKTLLKIRCVCKSWYSIIGSSEFTYIHLNRYKNNRDKTHVLVQGGFGKKSVFFLYKTQDFSKISLFHHTRDSYALIGSCNGLLLMRDTSSKEGGNTVRLWNPSIQRSLLLPQIPYYYQHYVVMGFSPSSNDYKVVAFYYVCNVLSYAVCSLYDQRWRVETMTKVTRPVCVSRLLGGGGYVYLQGAAYWIGDCPEQQLVCFDFDLEEFSFIELPDDGKKVTARIVFLLDESLAILSVGSKTSCVWVMEMDGNRKVTWRIWFSGECNLEASNLIKECTCNKSVVLHVKNTDMILVALSGKAYFYNIRNQKIEECKKTVRDLDFVSTYVESLVLH